MSPCQRSQRTSYLILTVFNSNLSSSYRMLKDIEESYYSGVRKAKVFSSALFMKLVALNSKDIV